MATPGADSASTAVEREKKRREQKVRSYWEGNEGIYVGKEAFDACFTRIKNWLNVSILVGHLMKHGLVSDPTDTESISSPYFLPDQRLNSLMGLAKKSGEHGYFLLYMCIRDSREENPFGHGDAVSDLESSARRLKLRPPWENSNSHPDNSSGPSPGPHRPHSNHDPHSSPAPSNHGQDTNPKGQDHVSVTCQQPLSQSINTSDDEPKGQGEIPSPRTDATPSAKNTRPMEKGSAMLAGVVQNVDPGKIIAAAKQASSIQSKGASVLATYAPQAAINTAMPPPVPETVNWSKEGDEVERDKITPPPPPVQRLDSQAPQGPSLVARVRDAISQGDINSLFEKFENEVDVDIVPEADCENKSVFMDAVCRFSTACLNSRDSGKIGILLAGINVDYSRDQPYAICGFQLLNVEGAIKDRVHQVLERSMSVREGKESVGTRPSCEELKRLVHLEFITPVDSSRAKLKTIVVVIVEPDWGICKNKLYRCRIVDDNGRSKPLEIWKRSEGGTVPVRPNKVPQLENALNNAYEDYSRS